MSIVIALAFVLILGALVLAGVFMLRGGSGAGSRSSRMVRALTVRIALSVALFACILLAWRFGWIHPTGMPIGR